MFADGPVSHVARWTFALVISSLPLAAQTAAPVVLRLTPLVESHAGTVPEVGVSHELAIARAARLSDLHYKLSFNLTPRAPATEAHETLTFNDGGTGDLPIDFRDGDLTSANLNGNELLTQTVNGHLILPEAALHKGQNTLNIAFKSNIAPAGKAITRYEDRDDKNEYLYTLFVPMDASMAFPCFDQPDLKARFALDVRAPETWTVIANALAISHKAIYSGTGYPEPPSQMKLVDTIKQGDSTGTTSFAETLPISTYLFAFAAGPFEAIPGAQGQPTLYVRKSQLARAKAEAPQVQQMTARGIAYLSDYFAQPFPFPKYDLVLIPGFPFGGMEHAGATFLNEDGVLFRTAPTASDYFRRNVLVLHETTHQWFGDLVTMRWFDDLWLKEGFAQYMAYKAMAQLEPASNPWKHFYEDIKPAAYGIDETQGTTPIYQNIPNLKDAKSAYGAIVYQKAPSVLKQLNFFLGEQNFRDGLRLYLKQHAYANAQWADLISAFEATGHQNVKTWADAWILHRGMPEVTAEFTCNGNRLGTIKLSQHDVLGTSFTWPISQEVFLNFPPKPASIKPFDLPVYEMEPIRVDWDRQAINVSSPHAACPTYIYVNHGDQAYGRFLLDPTSERAVTATLLGTPGTLSIADPLLKSQLWGALWDGVHTAATPSRSYVELVLKSLINESDESLNRIQGGRIAASLHAYLSDTARKALAPQSESLISDRMIHAPTLGLRIINFRTFTSIAQTPTALAQIKDLLSGKLTIEGMPLKPLDRWNLIGLLIQQNDPEAAALFAAEKERDHSGEGQKYAYAIEAGTPTSDSKQRYFNDYLTSPGTPQARQEDWLSQSLRPFNSWNQSTLTEPYLTRALDALPDIKRNRKIFFLGAWLGAFIGGQHSPEAQHIVHTWLTRKDIDPDLRLKVLEVSDELDRTVLIRQRFPE